MNTLNLLMQNGSQSILTGINSGLGAYFLMPDPYGYYELPFIGYDIPQWTGYALMGALSAASVNLTGDFILPLISTNTYLNKAAMLSRPASVGLLSLLVTYGMNSFEMIDYETMMKVFLLSSGSYLVADWTVNKIMPNSPNVVNVQQPRQVNPVVPRIPVDNINFDFPAFLGNGFNFF